MRIAFGDGTALGVLPDARLSTVSASSATTVADGVSTITLKIIPRDASGTPLGKGLSISLDAVALWPANIVGSVVDNSNGSYSVRVASSIPGTGNAAIAVEGIWLDSEAAVEFTDPGWGSLRDQAVDRLEHLAGSGGPLQELMDRLADSPVSGELTAGLRDLGKALSDLDNGWDAKALDLRLARALEDLGDARDQLSGQERDDLELLMDRLAAGGRLIAVHHIAQAEANCGVCSAGDPASVCQARASLYEGDAARAQNPPDHSGAVEKFAEAVDTAGGRCN